MAVSAADGIVLCGSKGLSSHLEPLPLAGKTCYKVIDCFFQISDYQSEGPRPAAALLLVNRIEKQIH